MLILAFPSEIFFFGTPFLAIWNFSVLHFLVSRLSFLKNFLDFFHKSQKCVIFYFFGKKNVKIFLGHLFLPIWNFSFQTFGPHVFIFWAIFLIFCMKATSLWYFLILEKKKSKLIFWTLFLAIFFVLNFLMSGLCFLKN